MAADARFKADTVWDLYRAIWRVTGRQQLVLIGLSLIVAALAAAPLKFQQLVVNSLVQAVTSIVSPGCARACWASPC